jgi:hypothetical protein
MRVRDARILPNEESMMDAPDFQLVPNPRREMPTEADPGASPFKIVIDPQMRLQLRRALIELIDNHDEALAAHYSDGKLALESYKEYIEVFARSLKETMAFPISCARSASMSRPRKSICVRNCAGKQRLPPEGKPTPSATPITLRRALSSPIQRRAERDFATAMAALTLSPPPDRNGAAPRCLPASEQQFSECASTSARTRKTLVSFPRS